MDVRCLPEFHNKKSIKLSPFGSWVNQYEYKTLDELIPKIEEAEVLYIRELLTFFVDEQDSIIDIKISFYNFEEDDYSQTWQISVPWIEVFNLLKKTNLSKIKTLLINYSGDETDSNKYNTDQLKVIDDYFIIQRQFFSSLINLDFVIIQNLSLATFLSKQDPLIGYIFDPESMTSLKKVWCIDNYNERIKYIFNPETRTVEPKGYTVSIQNNITLAPNIEELYFQNNEFIRGKLESSKTLKLINYSTKIFDYHKDYYNFEIEFPNIEDFPNLRYFTIKLELGDCCETFWEDDTTEENCSHGVAILKSIIKNSLKENSGIDHIVVKSLGCWVMNIYNNKRKEHTLFEDTFIIDKSVEEQTNEKFDERNTFIFAFFPTDLILPKILDYLDLLKSNKEVSDFTTRKIENKKFDINNKDMVNKIEKPWTSSENIYW
ncbi:hypothetical protein [Dasineura jujubifolia toursvirus 2a]|nr:hypothetical protein [Dasineura jujubifolia toursvirus 2a]